MPPALTSLASLRKSTGLSQQELGKALAGKLKRPIGDSYAQKKIANFEAGITSPAPDERPALAILLGVELPFLETLLANSPHDGVAIIHGFAPKPGGRTLVASCMLSRPRTESLAQTLTASKESIEATRVSMAVFVPYPRLSLQGASEQIDVLAGYYAHVRNSILDSNRRFKKSLGGNEKRVALYFPKADANILIPPVLRQFILRVEVDEDGSVTKSVNKWTPGVDGDESRPINPTGVYPLDVQVELWSAFFGDVVSHWIEADDFLPSDAYWVRVEPTSSSSNCQLVQT